MFNFWIKLIWSFPNALNVQLHREDFLNAFHPFPVDLNSFKSLNLWTNDGYYNTVKDKTILFMIINQALGL